LHAAQAETWKDDVVRANGEGAAKAAAQLGRETLGSAAHVSVTSQQQNAAIDIIDL
jgi:hypothetical protein